MIKHYSREQLDSYRHGDMNVFQRFLCYIHLKFCSECSNELSAVEEDDILLEDFKHSIDEFKITDDNSEYDKLCTIFHDKPITSSTV